MNNVTIGSPVKHLNYAHLRGHIIGDLGNRWKIRYNGENKQGSWFKKYTRRDNTIKESPEEPEGVTTEMSDDEITENIHPNPPTDTLIKPEKEMRAEIVHKTEINGRDINEMEASDILHAISNVQDRIEKMEKHKSKSAYVDQETKRLEKFVVEAYNILDDKFSNKPK